MQKITPFLWFNDNAEEAINFYVSVFKDAKIVHITRNVAGGPGPEGSVLVVQFELFGHEYVALNGGPQFSFNPAISFVVNCESQEEVDYYWSKLTEGGQEVQCGWLTDKYGLSWQITPVRFFELMGQGTPEQQGRLMQAMMQMVKFDIAKLEEAFRG